MPTLPTVPEPSPRPFRAAKGRRRSTLRRAIPWVALLAGFLVPGLGAAPPPAEPATSPPPPAAPPAAAEPAPQAGPDAGAVREESDDRWSRRRRLRKDAQVVVGSSLTIQEGERATDAVVVGGSLEVEGDLTGDAAAIGGAVRINGEVSGDVVAIGGSVELGPEAEVGGDVTSVGGRVEADPAAVVHGKVAEVPFGPGLRFRWPWTHGWRMGHRDMDFGWEPAEDLTDFLSEVVKFAVLALLACLALLLLRGPLETVARKVAADPLKSGLTGLLAQILFFPLLLLVIVVLCVSIIGIPLLILIPFALLGLVLVGCVGFAAVAQRTSAGLQSRFDWRIASPYLAIAVGVLGIQSASLVGDLLSIPGGPVRWFAWMFLLAGVLVKYLAWTVGFGAALLTRFGMADGWQRRAPAPPPPPPAPAALTTSPAAEPPAAGTGPVAGGDPVG